VNRDVTPSVGTRGIQQAISVTRPAGGGPAVGSFRSADSDTRPPETVIGAAVAQPAEALLHDDAAAQPRRASRPEPDFVVDQPPARETAAANVIAAAVAPTPQRLPPITATTVPVSAIAPGADESRVTQALNQYARAYGQLDASAARAVWPTVDERALARAFAGLESQTLSFEACDVNVHGITATASCRGRASYVGKVGNRERRTEARDWTFELRDTADGWKIQSAQAKR